MLRRIGRAEPSEDQPMNRLVGQRVLFFPGILWVKLPSGASSRLSKRMPFSGVFCAWATSDSTFAFAIGIAYAAGHGYRSVVRQHIAVEWIESGIVKVGGQHAFAQIVQHHQACGSAEPAKSPLMKFGPDACAGTKHQQSYRLPAPGSVLYGRF